MNHVVGFSKIKFSLIRFTYVSLLRRGGYFFLKRSQGASYVGLRPIGVRNHKVISVL